MESVMQSRKQSIVEQNNGHEMDRRGPEPEKSIWWDKLTLAQKFSASSLAKFGYELAFVRYQSSNNLAVMTCSTGLATISIDGEIDTQPSIDMR